MFELDVIFNLFCKIKNRNYSSDDDIYNQKLLVCVIWRIK